MLNRKLLILTTDWKATVQIMDSYLLTTVLLMKPAWTRASYISIKKVKSELKNVCWLSQSYTNKYGTTKTHFSDDSSIDCVLCELKKKFSKINFSYLNINSLRNKFEDLMEIIGGDYCYVLLKQKLTFHYQSVSFLMKDIIRRIA